MSDKFLILKDITSYGESKKYHEIQNFKVWLHGLGMVSSKAN